MANLGPRPTKLIFEGRVVQKGSNIGLVECKAVDLAGNLVAYATSTFMTRRFNG